MKKIFLCVMGVLLLFSGIWIGNSTQSGLSFNENILISVEEDLTSTEGLMRLIPQFRNANGLFEIPNPNTDLEKYLTVRQALINIIEIALTKANMSMDPYVLFKREYAPLKLPSKWLAAEVGFETDANTIPDFSNGGFGYYAGKSFLNGVVPLKGTNESFYTVPGSAVYMNLMPTSLKYVNRIMETSGLNGGTMIATSYVLGRKDGQAYLIVNGCQNTAKTVSVGSEQLLAPGASSFLGLQWVEEVP